MAVENYTITSPPLNDGSQNDGSTVLAQQSAFLKRPLFAAVCSAFIPGLGQWLLGAKRKGVLFFIAYCALVIGYFPLGLPRSYIAWYALVMGMLALCIVASANALWSSSVSVGPSSKWWLVILVPLALVTSTLHSNGLLIAAGFHIYGIPSTSMENTISRGDHIVADLRHFRNSGPQIGDLVIVRKEGQQIVKRVIAIGESTVEGKNGRVYVDGKALEEPYVVHTGNPALQLTQFGPVRVAKGMLFLMGVNRDVSYDSRMPQFGLVDQSTIVGKPLYIYRSDKDRTGTYVY